MTTGDGGIVITRDRERAAYMGLFADKAWPREGSVRTHLFLGQNYRMTELQGAVALAQLQKVQRVVARRRYLAAQLAVQLSDVPGVHPPYERPGIAHSYWLYPVRLDVDELGVSAPEFAKALQAEGIPGWAPYLQSPIYLYPALTEKRTYGKSRFPFGSPGGGRDVDYRAGMCPNAEGMLQDTVILPWNEHYTDADVEDLAAGLAKVAEHFASRTG
jgi:dTDP-4-amino-4,6-dideoxygalactose transaminase